MTERITQLIDRLHEKVNLMKDGLRAERLKVVERDGRIENLEAELASGRKQLEGMQLELDALKASMAATENVNIESAGSKGLSDDEIGELVKEIEFCITKLKS